MTAPLPKFPESPFAKAVRLCNVGNEEERLDHYSAAHAYFSLAQEAMKESDDPRAKKSIALLQKAIDRTGRMSGNYPARHDVAAISKDDEDDLADIFLSRSERARQEAELEDSLRERRERRR